MSNEGMRPGFGDIKFEPMHKRSEDRGYVYSDGSHAWRVQENYHLDTIVEDELSVPRHVRGETETDRINRYRVFVEQKFAELRQFGIDTEPTFINHPAPTDFVRHDHRLGFSQATTDALLSVAKIEKPIKYEDLSLFRKWKAISLYVKTYEALYQYVIATAGKGNLSQSSERSIFWDIGGIDQYVLIEEHGTLRFKLVDIDPYISRSRKRRTQLVDACIVSLKKVQTIADASLWTRRSGTAKKISNLISLFEKEKPYWTAM